MKEITKEELDNEITEYQKFIPNFPQDKIDITIMIKMINDGFSMKRFNWGKK
jgi:hypothetical protein